MSLSVKFARGGGGILNHQSYLKLDVVGGPRSLLNLHSFSSFFFQSWRIVTLDVGLCTSGERMRA